MPTAVVTGSSPPQSVDAARLGEEALALHLVAADELRRQGRTRRLGALDALLPVALVLWWIGVHSIDPRAMNEYGLLAALPVVFVVSVMLLVFSVVVVFARPTASPLRLGLHLVALVIVLHGTVPLVFSQPIYPWLYKHVGVVRYINLHSGLDTSVDIYHNWPGFFALGAWFTRVAGVGSPLAYAAWAPVYFNLLTCLAMSFAFRSLPVSQRVRWLGLFLFVAGNWVGQDYFAPQALAMLLSVTVIGMALAWLQADRPSAVVRAGRCLVQRVITARPEDRNDEDGSPPTPGPRRAVALSAVLCVYTVVVVTHQLSPYVIVLGLALLAVAGLVRPRWVVVALAAIAIVYLVLHYSYVDSTQDLFASLFDPLENINGDSTDAVAMTGRRLTALAAPALIIGLWTLGILGAVRRLRCRRSTLLMGLLAAAPAVIVLGQSYGGEAIFRIYLFSLPWTALLAASALEPRSQRWRPWSVITVGVVLLGSVGLFMSSFFGSLELYEIRPGEVEASQYFYDHAEPTSVLALVAPNFPTRLAERYDQFRSAGDNLPNLLTTAEHFRHRMLGADDLPAIADFVGGHVTGGGGGRYLAVSTGQRVYAEVLGLLPKGSMASLERALASSPSWSLLYRNPDAAIYRLGDRPADEEGGVRAAARARTSAVQERSRDRSVDWAGIGIGVAGAAVIGVVVRRRWRTASKNNAVLTHKEEPMAFPVAVDEVVDGAVDGDVVPAEAPEPVRAPERLEVMVSRSNLEERLSRAVLMPADARHLFVRALADLEPERARLPELVSSVKPAHRPQAVRLLREAWGPMSSSNLGPLLSDLSSQVRVAAVGALDASAESVAVLRHLLSDDLSADVRTATVIALTRAPEEDQLSALSLALADPQESVRATAVEVLPAAGSPRAASLLSAACEDEHRAVRLAAHRRLVSRHSWLLWMALQRSPHRDELCAVLEEAMPTHRLTTLVRERMYSPDPGDRVLAVELAGRLGVANWPVEIIDALADPEASVRQTAARQLRGHATAAPALITVLQDDPDPAVRQAAALALDSMEIDSALLAFIGALQDPAADVRRVVIRALVRRSSPGLARRVASVLATANIASVGEVLAGMGEVGQSALVAAVVEGTRDQAPATLEVLRKTGGTDGLLVDLRAADPASRLRAVEALGALGNAQDALISALADAWPGIRSRAAFHLGQTGDGRAGAALRRVAESDQAPEVVQAATDGLRTIETRGSGMPADMG